MLFSVWCGLFQAKGNIGKFKITRTAGCATSAIFPGAFASWSFEAVARSDPQLLRTTGRLGLFCFFTKENVRAALSRECKKRNLPIATAADAEFLYVWRENR